MAAATSSSDNGTPTGLMTKQQQWLIILTEFHGYEVYIDVYRPNKVLRSGTPPVFGGH